jgi:cytochrome c551/c552
MQNAKVLVMPPVMISDTDAKTVAKNFKDRFLWDRMW